MNEKQMQEYIEKINEIIDECSKKSLTIKGEEKKKYNLQIIMLLDYKLGLQKYLKEGNLQAFTETELIRKQPLSSEEFKFVKL